MLGGRLANLISEKRGGEGGEYLPCFRREGVVLRVRGEGCMRRRRQGRQQVVGFVGSAINWCNYRLGSA